MKTLKLAIVFSALAYMLPAQVLHTKHQSLPCLNKKFSIVAHLVRDSLGNIGITEEEILESLDSLNYYFSPICVSFEVCDFRIIDNFQYDNPAGLGIWNQMKDKFHQKNRINVFFVRRLVFRPQACGYTDFGNIENLDGGGVIMVKSCVQPNGKDWAHEMGHYFGLLDTSQGDGMELVNGANCETEGDQICDTPADPYVITDFLPEHLNDNPILCRFIWEGQDANGAYYVPDVGNMMSVYPTICRCGFSWEQYARMANLYIQAPRKMW